jgi:hypothetical protein
MQSFVLFSKVENEEYFPKIYIGRGPTSKHSTPRVKPFHKPTTNTQAAPAPNSKDSLGLTSSECFVPIGIYQYSVVFSSHECGIHSQNFKNKKHRVTLCAQVSTRGYVSSNGQALTANVCRFGS